MFTQYLYSPVQLSEAAVSTAASLAQTQPGEDPAIFAAQIIAERLRDDPMRYLEYGPYWWAVKAALRERGFDFGPADDDQVRIEYGGRFPAYTSIVAGEQFRDYYLQHFFAGASLFWLDDQAEESYALADQDMEIRRLAHTSPLRVAYEVAQMVEGDDAEGGAVLDGIAEPVAASPYFVGVEHDAQLWRVSVYAQNPDAAHDRVRQMQGDIDRAIDAGGVNDLFVDVESRTLVEMRR